MNYLGDFPTGATIYIPFATYDKDDGSSITMTGLAVTDIEIYKNGSATQRASDNGYTLLDTDGIDFDTITGLHGFSVNTSDNSDAGFYAAGNEYQVAVSAITVDGVTVNFWAATFSIERSGGALALLKHATYGLSAIETLVDDLETRCTEARLSELDAANLPTDVAAVKTDTAAILLDTDVIGAAGAGLTAIPWNASWDAEVQSECADALTAYGASTHSAADVWAVATRILTAGTNIVLAKGTGVTGFNDLAVADIFTGQMTEAYAADGTAPTLAQMQYMIWSALSQMAISGTTITCKKLDGTTTSMTFTTDSATNPTSRTRAT